MTIIKPNSIAGITSITAQEDVINFYSSDGTAAGLQLNGVNFNTTSGVSTFNNLTVGAALSLTDNVKAQFGTGGDLEIYHDGSNSYIVDKGTGGLVLGGNFVAIRKDDLVEAQIIGFSDAQVQLYYDNSEKLTTTSTGIDVTGTVQANRIDAFNTGAPMIVLRDTDSSGNSAITYIEGQDSAGTQQWYIGDINTNGDLRIRNVQSSSSMVFGTSNLDRVMIDPNGHLLPDSDNTYNLGSSSKRWANVYSADLQLSNEGSTNDVDGTWGKYTIQEGENDLFLINRRTGKKYKFMLEEVK